MVKAVCLLTASFPAGERSDLVGQVDRAAVSMPSNIAEGCGRATRHDRLQFLRIARGDAPKKLVSEGTQPKAARRARKRVRAFELETQLVPASDLGLCGVEDEAKISGMLHEVIRVLQGLMAVLERRTER